MLDVDRYFSEKYLGYWVSSFRNNGLVWLTEKLSFNLKSSFNTMSADRLCSKWILFIFAKLAQAHAMFA